MHNAMIKVSSAEFQRNIGRYQDLAMTQPIAVTRNGRERTVMVSVEEYNRLKRRDRRALRLEDITDEMLEAIENAEPSPEAEAFNDEFKV
jgi:prevent-host-death family protein